MVRYCVEDRDGKGCRWRYVTDCASQLAAYSAIVRQLTNYPDSKAEYRVYPYDCYTVELGGK